MADSMDTSPELPDNVGKFDDTMRRLVRVPKAEADKEETKWQKMQERAKVRRAEKRREKK